MLWRSVNSMEQTNIPVQIRYVLLTTHLATCYHLPALLALVSSSFLVSPCIHTCMHDVISSWSYHCSLWRECGGPPVSALVLSCIVRFLWAVWDSRRDEMTVYGCYLRNMFTGCRLVLADTVSCVCRTKVAKEQEALVSYKHWAGGFRLTAVRFLQRSSHGILFASMLCLVPVEEYLTGAWQDSL